MNYRSVKIASRIIALVLGASLFYLKIISAFYIFAISGLLLGMLMVKVKFRNKDYFGIPVASVKSASFEYSKVEKDIAVAILLFMASPFIYMLLAAVYGYFAL